MGIIEGEARLDLPYIEDAAAEVDFYVVMTGSQEFVEVQGTAEEATFTRSQLDELIELASAGIDEIIRNQKNLLAAPPSPRK